MCNKCNIRQNAVLPWGLAALRMLSLFEASRQKLLLGFKDLSGAFGKCGMPCTRPAAIHDTEKSNIFLVASLPIPHSKGPSETRMKQEKTR
jgi:hypothetical protein